ncbi:prepilin-type N-terminal cleavage/methylation domain-containing protein [Clostridium senegalense]|uniref:type II secretion system protein n=1 Tax=Clostridium senegalense TaxID=1465809 RepID=UPI001C0F746D|nr:prepilin-type N-terminal cleavage/methylation domain-containing protein [Clostridium senegalense]MBU5225166.1 prepilin-type N-terminal cleavage/methylation domain-containing protein [Clostridium senegalense]
MKNIRRKKKGFTLIELVVVISIIAILAIIAVPKFGQIQQNAKQRADIATAKNIAMAVNSQLSCGKTIDNLNETEIYEYFNGDIKQQAKVGNQIPGEFTVYLMANDNIVITTGSRQVYPSVKEDYTSSGTGKSISIKCNRNN